VAGVPVTWRTKLAATRASVGSDCVFSHRTAGNLLQLDGRRDGPIEISIHRSLSRPGVIVHRLQSYDRPRTVRVDGFTLTAPDRTVMDLFAVLDPGRAELALDDALRRGLVSIDRLWRTSHEFGRRGRRGCGAFRAALLRRDDRDGTLATRMEAKLLAISRRIAPPDGFTQHEVVADGKRYFIDLAYPHIKLGVEAHSIKWHMGEARWQHDIERDRNLKLVGWTLVYYSWDDLDLRSKAVAEEIAHMRDRLEAKLF